MFHSEPACLPAGPSNHRVGQLLRRPLVIALFLALFTGGVYFPVLRADYVAYDDELLIVDNVKARGVTWENVKQAFTTYDPELYIPLTLLTEQVEYSIVGAWNPAMSHGINLALHLLNAVLVFWLMMLLLRACHAEKKNSQDDTFVALPMRFGGNSPFVALVVALLWAIHPLNVEAVAWASARKDLLSGFFFLLSLCGYLKWRECVTLSSPTPLTMTRRWYWSSIVAFLLGLLAKVSIAPLPLVLLLLEKMEDGRWKNGERTTIRLRSWQASQRATLMRLLPFFTLSIIFGIIAVIGKESQVHALGATILAPFLAIPFYLQKLFIPLGLSVLYPFTEDLTVGHPSVLFGMSVVVAITVSVWWGRRWSRIPLLAWTMFLLLLAPSFLNVAKRGDGGIVDLTIASDRYMYLAMLGPLILLGTALVSHRRARYALFPVLGVFAFLTVRQMGVWHDSETLFRNVLTQHQASHIAANNLAGFRARKGETIEAMELYRQSLAIRENPRALFNLGQLLVHEKRFQEALPLFEKYVALKPRDAFGRMQLGGLYLLRDDAAAAHLHLEEAVARDANLTEAHYLLGVALERLGDRAGARKEFQETLRLEPDHPHARGKLAG